ncbi:hypothetical protein FQN57_007213 [Myotisia sp. PD_48]|nr:hypothetical protein FQN57_007213 [Myotisia sp. PD_48]
MALLLIVGGILVVLSIVYVTINMVWYKIDVDRFRGARKAYSASTPPPSVSLPKLQTTLPQYKNTLPPLRGEFLPRAPQDGFGMAFRNNLVTEEQVLNSILPLTTNYLTCKQAKYTTTGFSVADLKALGSFPNYSALSSVPLPQPYLEFDINKALPRPYRPFRWNYHQTMSLTKMEPNWWLELENTYKDRVAERMELHKKYGKTVLDYLPGSELACKELMEMCIQFLCARYPQYFSLSDDKRHFSNGILDRVEDLETVNPIDVLMANVPEDFAIMLRDDQTGNYYLRAGATCSSLGWNLGTKIGLELHDIHRPIPDYKEKMQFSMGRMPADKPIQRGSWGLEVGKPLFMPPGNVHELHRLSQNQSLKESDCYLRVDWQTLRRLPLSGAIVFNFKAVFTPISEFRDEPGIPALLAKILKEGKKSIMEYKNTWHVEHVCIPAFERWAKEQEESGVVEKGWEVSTLKESPYFKGWEEKWHAQQGF